MTSEKDDCGLLSLSQPLLEYKGVVRGFIFARYGGRLCNSLAVKRKREESQSKFVKLFAALSTRTKTLVGFFFDDALTNTV